MKTLSADPDYQAVLSEIRSNREELEELVRLYHNSKYFQDFKAWKAEWHRVNQDPENIES